MQYIKTKLNRSQNRHCARMSNLVYLPTLIREAQSLFRKLLEKADALEHKYLNYYGDEDIRPEMFHRQVFLNIRALIEFDDILDIMNDKNGKVSRYAQFPPQGRAIFNVAYETTNRSSYCIQAMFSIEHCLALIAERLGLGHDTYSKTVNELQSALGINDDQKKILLAPAYFRNSLHNNGYHLRGDNFDLSLGKEVVHSKKPDQVTGFIVISAYHIFSDIYDVLDLVFENYRVRFEPRIPHNSTTYHDIQ
jgi:hypothetical protein